VSLVVPGLLFGGLLFWRVADASSFTDALGEGTAAVILVAGPVVLGVTWPLGLRAWAAMRGSDG
jgi:hypothetical protein